LIPGLFPWSAHAYDHGKIFVVSYDGLLRVFDAATGQTGWSTQLPGQYAFSAPPTAVNGVVYVGGAGSGGTLYAVDESNGNVLWTAGVANGDRSSPAVSSDGIFVTYPCQAYKFDPLTGAAKWHYNGGCSGGGGRTAAFANDRLYMRDWTNPVSLIFNAATGVQTDTFTASAIPAFSAQSGFFLDAGMLRAVDLNTQNALWNFTGDGSLVSAPIVIDDVVIIGSSSGNVYALNAATGAQTWSGSAGAAITPPDELNLTPPITGFGAGEGYLVVPAGSVLTGWHLSGP
jgi:outer membrane protein assembly factor BamB